MRFNFNFVSCCIGKESYVDNGSFFLSFWNYRFIKRGIIILLVGIGLSFGPELFLPWYFAFPPLYAYKIWQLMDAYKYQQIRNGNIPVTKTVT
jgi:hypothetical protein